MVCSRIILLHRTQSTFPVEVNISRSQVSAARRLDNTPIGDWFQVANTLNFTLSDGGANRRPRGPAVARRLSVSAYAVPQGIGLATEAFALGQSAAISNR